MTETSVIILYFFSDIRLAQGLLFYRQLTGYLQKSYQPILIQKLFDVHQALDLG